MVGVALAASSCNLDVADEGASIALYIEVDKGTLLTDETVTVTVTARNVGFEPFTLTGPDDCLVYIEILNTQGTRHYNSAASCSGNTVTQEIAAGADYVQTFVWDGSGTGGTRVPSGLYNIRPIAQVTGQAYLGPAATIAVE
jgi:hypothetical protein